MTNRCNKKDRGRIYPVVGEVISIFRSEISHISQVGWSGSSNQNFECDNMLEFLTQCKRVIIFHDHSLEQYFCRQGKTAGGEICS